MRKTSTRRKTVDSTVFEEAFYPVIDKEKEQLAQTVLHDYVKIAGKITSLYYRSLMYRQMIVMNTPYNEYYRDFVKEMIEHAKKKKYEIKTLSSLLYEKADILKKIGIDPKEIIYMLYGSESEYITQERSEIGVSGYTKIFTPVYASMGAGIGKTEGRLTNISLENTRAVAKYSVKLLLEQIRKPTIILLTDTEMRLFSPEVLYDSVVSNKNIVLVAFMPHRVSREYVELSMLEGTFTPYPLYSFRLYNRALKTYLSELNKSLLRDSGLIIKRMKGTRRGLQTLIDLILFIPGLTNMITRKLYRITKSIPQAIILLNKILAKTYARLRVNVMDYILSMYRKNRDPQIFVERLKTIIMGIIDGLNSWIESDTSKFTKENVALYESIISYTGITDREAHEILMVFTGKQSIKKEELRKIIDSREKKAFIQILERLGIIVSNKRTVQVADKYLLYTLLSISMYSEERQAAPDAYTYAVENNLYR